MVFRSFHLLMIPKQSTIEPDRKILSEVKEFYSCKSGQHFALPSSLITSFHKKNFDRINHVIQQCMLLCAGVNVTVIPSLRIGVTIY